MTDVKTEVVALVLDEVADLIDSGVDPEEAWMIVLRERDAA